MKTIYRSSGEQENKTQGKGGKSLPRHFPIQTRWVHTVEDVENMPRSSWRGHIAERIGHLILIALIWITPIQPEAEILARTSVDTVSSRTLHIEFLNIEASFDGDFGMAILSRDENEIAWELRQFQIKDQVLLSWKTFFRDQSMLRRRIDVYA